MALISECRQLCANNVLDRADIVRDGDFVTATTQDAHCPNISRTMAAICFRRLSNIFSVSMRNPPQAPPLKCDVGCWQSFANDNQVRNIGIFGVSSDDVVNETGLMVFRKRGESVVDATKENWVGTLCRGPIRHTWWRWHKVCLYFFVAYSKPNIELLSLIRE